MISEKDHDDILASAEGSFEVPSFKKTHLKRCKGVKRHLLRQKVLHKHFRASVEDKKNKMVDFYSINSKKHTTCHLKALFWDLLWICIRYWPSSAPPSFNSQLSEPGSPSKRESMLPPKSVSSSRENMRNSSANLSRAASHRSSFHESRSSFARTSSKENLGEASRSREAVISSTKKRFAGFLGWVTSLFKPISSASLHPPQVGEGEYHLELVGVVEHKQGASQQRDEVKPCHEWGSNQCRAQSEPNDRVGRSEIWEPG